VCEDLAEAEFPYPAPQKALERISNLFKRKLARLQGLGDQADQDVVNNACALATEALFTYLPLLGFIHRSTNVRNAFEIVRPLSRLAQRLFAGATPNGRSVKLVLSSEWNYSPVVLPGVEPLEDFLLLGLPASESSAPFLLPLAGHEFGHRLWVNLEMGPIVENWVMTEILKETAERWAEYKQLFPEVYGDVSELDENLLTVYGTWQPVMRWALGQAAESFSDFLGVRVFGRSYLSAFAYLLSPKVPGRRPVKYPDMVTRVENVARAAQEYAVPVPDGYVNMFRNFEPTHHLTPREAFQLTVIDIAIAAIVPVLITLADEYATLVGIEKRTAGDDQHESKVRARFEMVAPAEGCKNLTHILNAAWQVYDDEHFWKDDPQLDKRKDHILRNLVLKNLEVFEIEQVIGAEQP
jgi:hypothetical protein